jgi:KipI family sensor histidine kinase inhibitor
MGLLDGATIRGSGEDAFVVEYGEVIDPAIERRFLALARAFDAARPAGLVEVVPTFRSLLVLYDSEAATEAALLDAVRDAPEHADTRNGRDWRVPVCMEGAMAEDIDAAADGLGLTAADVREIFLAGTYTLGMYGFTPGCAYFSGVDRRLAIPRRKTPRPPVAANSLIIAGGMANIMPVSMPTGWYVIGRVAVTMFRVDADPMVPFAVGDRLTFEPVSAGEIERLAGSGTGGVRPA